MDTTLLKNFLKVVDRSKYEKGELEEKLFSKGWDKETIDKAFREIKEEAAMASSVHDGENDENGDLSLKLSDFPEMSAPDQASEASRSSDAEKSEKDAESEPLMPKKKYLPKEEYVKAFASAMMPFIQKGYSSYYIRRQFLSAGWEKSLFQRAYDMAETDVIYRRKSLKLEKEILLRLLSGEKKEHVVKVLIRKGWPDDILKRNFESIEEGLEHLQDKLYEVDLNHYNVQEIKEVLLQKGWPKELVERTLMHLQEKIEYHRSLQHIQSEVRSMLHAGKKVKDVERRLMDEGYPKGIVDRIILKLNVELVRAKDIEKFKKFNETELKHGNYHHFSELTSYFDHIDSSVRDLIWPDSIGKKANKGTDGAKEHVTKFDRQESEQENDASRDKTEEEKQNNINKENKETDISEG